MPRYGYFATAAMVAVVSSPAVAQTAPAGWTADDTRVGAVTYTPGDLKPGEVYNVTVYDSEALSGKTVSEWLTEFASRGNARPGALSGPLNVKSGGMLTTGNGVFTGANGQKVAGIFLGFTADGGENAYMTRVVFSGQAGLFDRYKTQTGQITNALVARAKREAGGKIAQAPRGLPKGMALGGKLQPGVYVGTQYRGDELGRRFRVYLYPGGEYRVCDQNDKDYDYNDGTVEYNPNNGKLTISRSFDLTNSSIDPDEDFCFYGRDEKGKPFIYAENDHGVSVYRTLLRYAGPPSKPSVSAEQQAKAAAEAEAKRYKYVTAPGKGVPMSRIEAVVHHYDVEMYSAGVNGMGSNVTDEAYLLLKDGTIHDGLPVAPDQLDVSLSRRREPEKWGHWRKEGNKYLVAWADKPGQYKPLPGKKVLPGAPGTGLQGRWGTGSSEASIAGSSYRLWGVTFTRDGRFKKDNRGGTTNGTFMQQGGQMAINSTYDDEGSVTSATNSNIAVMRKRRSNPNGDKEGTYSINGYSLTLNYDNGSVARLPFFFGDPTHETLWFEGNQLALDDKK